jgi:hypothetical protein
MAQPTVIQYPTDAVFVASTQAGVALSTGLSVTQTGFTLYNPIGSATTLLVLEVAGALTTAPAAISTVVLAANVNPNAVAPATNTVLVTRSAKLGNTTQGVGIAYSATTLPAAPVVVMGLGGPVATGSVSQPQILAKIEGGLAIEPGCCLSINALTTAISGVWSMIWQEVPQL